jgi:hypothetical protein
MIDTLSNIREMVGGRYKIIQQRYHGQIRTKILLDREEDLMFIILANPEMVCRAYRYV